MRTPPSSLASFPTPDQNFFSECFDFLVHVDLPAQEGLTIRSLRQDGAGRGFTPHGRSRAVRGPCRRDPRQYAAPLRDASSPLSVPFSLPKKAPLLAGYVRSGPGELLPFLTPLGTATVLALARKWIELPPPEKEGPAATWTRSAAHVDARDSECKHPEDGKNQKWDARIGQP